MDKNAIFRLQTTIQDIRKKLLFNENIRKLLVNDIIEDLDTCMLPTIEQAKEHIFLLPIVEVDTLPPYDKKNYITITAPERGISNGEALSIDQTIQIMVICHKKLTIFGEDHIRSLCLEQEIINEIDNCKFSFSNVLSYFSSEQAIINKDALGYAIMFGTIDGTSSIEGE